LLLNGDIEINLGAAFGVLEGTISDDSEIRTKTLQGVSSSGVVLEIPSGFGDFYLGVKERKYISIRFQTLVERKNVCSLDLRKM